MPEVKTLGGRATDGLNRILDLEVNELDQRTSIFIARNKWY